MIKGLAIINTGSNHEVFENAMKRLNRYRYESKLFVRVLYSSLPKPLLLTLSGSNVEQHAIPLLTRLFPN